MRAHLVACIPCTRRHGTLLADAAQIRVDPRFAALGPAVRDAPRRRSLPIRRRSARRRSVGNGGARGVRRRRGDHRAGAAVRHRRRRPAVTTGGLRIKGDLAMDVFVRRAGPAAPVETLLAGDPVHPGDQLRVARARGGARPLRRLRRRCAAAARAGFGRRRLLAGGRTARRRRCRERRCCSTAPSSSTPRWDASSCWACSVRRRGTRKPSPPRFAPRSRPPAASRTTSTGGARCPGCAVSVVLAAQGGGAVIARADRPRGARLVRARRSASRSRCSLGPRRAGGARPLRGGRRQRRRRRQRGRAALRGVRRPPRRRRPARRRWLLSRERHRA